MKRLAILGTGLYNLELIKRAKKLDYETHMFGVQLPDILPRVGHYGPEIQLEATKYADHFHNLSIVWDQEKILNVCQELKVDGVVSLGMESAVQCTAYLGNRLGLPQYNSEESALYCTDKWFMKTMFKEKGIPTTDFSFMDENMAYEFRNELKYPVVVKTPDRAGKCGITKVNEPNELMEAVRYAFKLNEHSDKVLIEQCARGKEWTVEAISYNGMHFPLTFTEKFSGPPHFVEEMHLQPAPIPMILKAQLIDLIPQVLNALKIKWGPSHTELRVDDEGNINIIEVAGRVVGDNIWECILISTGMDWVQMAFDIAIGKEPDLRLLGKQTGFCGVSKFLMSKEDFENWEFIKKNCPEKIVSQSHIVEEYDDREVLINGMRFGGYVLRCKDRQEALTLTKPAFWSQ